MAMFYANQEEDASDVAPQNPPQQEQPVTGPRTLGGDGVPSRPAPTSAIPSTAQSSRPPKSQQKKKFGSLRDLQTSGGGPAGSGHDDDSDYDPEDENQDFFAGGEKSGLAVQNPNNPSGGGDHESQIRNILERARRNAQRPGADEETPAPRQTRFTGAGMTLGGDDAPSRRVEDPRANVPSRATRVQRTMHLWRNGISIDDGPLFRFDDPANAGMLEMINQGRAPLSIMNVEPAQEVDVTVNPHREEDYVAAKKKYKPFEGGGQRLGNPVPGVERSSSSSTQAQQQGQQTAPTATASSFAPQDSSTLAIPIDSSQPTLTLQIRLGDGTRLSSRFNTTHTVGDVYGFVDRARPEGRRYALMTTFPSKELSDKAQPLGEMAEFKRGGVVVQKWT